MRFWISVIVFAIGIVSCTQDEPNNIDLLLRKEFNRTTNDGLYGLILPDSDNYSKISQDLLNPLSTAKVQLGKLLFHETALATDASFSEKTNTYSCASCHHA